MTSSLGWQDSGIDLAGKRSSKRSNSMRAGRKNAAMKAREDLHRILFAPKGRPKQMVDAAARQMWRLGTRHRIGLHPDSKHWICRGCKTSMRPGVTTTVRIRGCVRISTCLNCGHIRRFILSKEA
ncbi:MAG: hypothetical protein QGF72_02890 [Candidatus Poseidoniaceae archaeon]|jgi:RNase P subunit RPR2|nr:hypothetical protein [Candidatus Poseidoniaceae archaeon]